MVTVADLRANEQFRQIEKEKQFSIPYKINHRMKHFPHVPWVVATNLYGNAVQAVLWMYNVEILIDIPFGQGYARAADLFFKAMKTANENYKVIKND